MIVMKALTRVLVGVLCLVQVSAPAAGVSRNPRGTETFLPKQESVLLLDDHTVSQTANLVQHFFPASKHSANPVMSRTQAWEGAGPYCWGSRLMQDDVSGLLRLWYIAYHYEGNFYRWGYATSRDGLHWEKPNLGVERFGNALAGNCLPLGPHPEKGARSIARDPRPQTPPDRRYLGVRFTYEGEFVSFSPDGIAWAEYPLNPAWMVPSDIIHVMWDDGRDRFVAYYKVWEVRGTEPGFSDSAAGRPFVTYMPWYNMKQLPNGTAEFDGPCVSFRSDAAADVQKKKFVLRARNQGNDDGGGASLSGAWTAKRVQCWAESEDGIHWKNEQGVLHADKQDPPTANIQFMFVMQYGGYYVGFLTMHDEAGCFRIQLSWSKDGLHWLRPWRDSWLDIGPHNAFDAGMVLGPADPILWEKEMWFPYGGFPVKHDSKQTDWQSAIGIATCRLDGFAAWQAGETTGELVTQPLRCDGDRLFVNADAKDGEVVVEVLDENGNPVGGLQGRFCRAIVGDTLQARDAGWAQWKDTDMGVVKGRTIRLRFLLRRAKLYSFRIATAQTERLPVPRATTR